MGISNHDPLGVPAIESVLEALAEFPAYQPPAVLYRFYDERATSSLTRGKLKLTPIAEFNDPFEVWAGLSDANLTEENVLRSAFTPGSLFRAALEANYPGYNLGEMKFESTLAATIKASPEYYRQHLKSMIDAISTTCASDVGASCFSAFSEEEFHGPLGIHHWAMYGRSHEGFAIAYDGGHPQMRALAESKWLFPVDYVDERLSVELPYFDDWNDRKMWRTFRHWLALKSRQSWEHEKEWRLVFPIKCEPDSNFVREDIEGRMHYFLKLWSEQQSADERSAHASIVSSVFLGVRAKSKLVDEILAAVSDPHLRHVSVYRMEIDASRYALVPRLLRQGDSSRVAELRGNLVRVN